MAVRHIIIFICALFLFSETAQANEITPPPAMILPVDCDLGWDCWIANYVDHDQGDGAQDYACGQQTYDRHKGTDFMIRNYRDMQAGVLVRAVSDGFVVGTRDGMLDIDFRKLPEEKVSRKACGNGVRINHGKGWVTQYCHLRKNSIRVKKGDAVKQGDIIGLVGNSGKAIFPHVHFRVEYIQPDSGKRRGSIVDPFVGIARTDQCKAGEKALWSKSLLATLPYRQVDIFDLGFAATQPKYDGLVQGLYEDETLSIRSPRLFLWGRFLHVQKGDRLTYVITGPDGEEVLNYTSTIDKDQAYRTLHAGVRRPTLNWDPGTYHGEIELVRPDDSGGRVYKAQATISMR